MQRCCTKLQERVDADAIRFNAQLDEIVSLKLKREADKRRKARELTALLEERKIRQRRAAERLKKRSRL